VSRWGPCDRRTITFKTQTCLNGYKRLDGAGYRRNAVRVSTTICRGISSVFFFHLVRIRMCTRIVRVFVVDDDAVTKHKRTEEVRGDDDRSSSSTRSRQWSSRLCACTCMHTYVHVRMYKRRAQNTRTRCERRVVTTRD